MQTPAQQTPPKPIIVILYGAGIQARYELSGKHLLKIWDQLEQYRKQDASNASCRETAARRLCKINK